MKHVIAYEWKLFLRNKTALFAWLFLFAVGLYALHYGRSFNQTQFNTLNKIDTAYQNRIKNQLSNFSADTSTSEGKSKYNNARDPFLNEWSTRPMAWKEPSGLQALSLGQSDNQPFYYNLWVYNNVYNNKHVELRNPDKLMSGNFDLAFVFLYLLPLLIIALSYNVRSHDDEQGITGLLLTQGISGKRILIQRLLFRGLLIVVLVSLLSIIGTVLNQVPIMPALAWAAVSLLYVLFWFALVYALASPQSSGSVTALKLVSAWVILLLLIPSLINNFQETDREAKMEVADASREYAGTIWSMEKKKLADTLFALKPAWKELFALKKDTNELRSTAYAYFMAQKLNAVGRHIDSMALSQQQVVERLNFVNPTYAAQLLFNKLAGTELSNYIDFRKRVSDYQQDRYERITVKRLPGEKLSRSDYEAYPLYQQAPTRISGSEWIVGVGPLLLFILFFTIVGNYSWKIQTSLKNN